MYYFTSENILIESIYLAEFQSGTCNSAAEIQTKATVSQSLTESLAMQECASAWVLQN